MTQLSVTIITLNEEENLPKALLSVNEMFADLPANECEIIVVDSGSTDKTVEIARKHGAKVFHRKFDNYSSQKNFALEQASGEWILSLDADEEISPQLGQEIKKAIESENFVAYTMPRKNIILGKFIRYTRWQPELDRHIWLWRKGKGKWVGEIHEEVEVTGPVGKLENPKIHRHYETVAEFVAMINSYSEADAQSRIKRGVKFNIFKLFFDPIYNFLVRYFYRLGFLDGWRGFVLSYLMAMYHFILWVKIWERRK